MNSNSEWNNFIHRSENFHWDINICELNSTENKLFYETLYKLRSDTINFLKENSLSREQILEYVFSKIYTFITMRFFEFAYFLKEAPLYDNVYDSCLFTSLCMYLHNTKRIDGISLSEFTYENSPYQFNVEGTDNYCTPDDYPNLLTSDSTSLRQKRYRLLSSRPVYTRRPQWSAMSEDSIYEWNLYYILESNSSLDKVNEWRINHNLTADEFDIIKETHKRIGNLNNALTKALGSEKNNNYRINLKKAYKRYISKLRKLKYENYLKLQKVLLSYHCEEKKFYGIRIYRLEKEYKPYNIIYEVNQLLKCETDGDKDAVLTKSIILKDIFFPKLYRKLFDLHAYPDIESCAKNFQSLNHSIVISSCLIFDELIEKGYLGDDWKDFLDNILYELTEKVFYNPAEIDYTTLPESQDAFIKILSAPVQDLLQKAGITFNENGEISDS